MKPGIAPPWVFIMPIVGGIIGGALIVICAICAVTLPCIAGTAGATGVGGAGGLQFCVGKRQCRRYAHGASYRGRRT